jgi:hypothetical protein
LSARALGDVNDAAVDRYTLGHASIGVLYGLARLPWWAALGLAVGWELVEDQLKDAMPGVFPYAAHDSLANATCDAAAVMVGYALIRALPPLPKEK